MRSFEENLTIKIHKISFMCVCKYLNQRVTRIGERMVVSKTRKKHLKGLSFITQFKTEFLLPFTVCRKVVGKMPGN